MRLVVLIFILGVVSCSSQKQLQKNALVYYGKSKCLGKCPVFDLYVYENGAVEYNGIMNVSKKGKHTFTIDNAVVKKIKEEINKLSVLESSGKKIIRDYPHTIIKIRGKEYVFQKKSQIGGLEKLLESVIHN